MEAVGEQGGEQVNPMGDWRPERAPGSAVGKGVEGKVPGPSSHHRCLCLVACLSRPSSASSFLRLAVWSYS